ncbi:SNF1-interacting protein [Tulasnella sp. 427]|nr:SNF1-interacting protein [Tulasnella sp. 427]
MGNASSKDRHDDSVDFGALHPQGIYTGPQDWNTEIVGRLIVERKLAPFYRPLEDYEEGWDDDQILAARKEPPPPPLPEPGQPSSSGHQQAPPPTPVAPHHHRVSSTKSAKAAAKEPQRLTEAKAYHGAVECPICFLIKRAEPTPTHLESEPACCPYCVQPNFGVLYKPPSWRTGIGSDGPSSIRPDLYKPGSSGYSTDMPGGLSQAPKQRRKSLSHLNDDVVTIGYRATDDVAPNFIGTADQIRPDWEEKLNQVKAAVARRANRRIIMRQVGDRLIPVGVTSGRIHPVDPNAPPGEEGRRRRRQQPNGDLGNLLQSMGITIPGQDLEDIMMQEAMRLSLLEHEADEKRRQKEKDKENANGANGQSSNGAGPSNSANTGSSTPDNGSSIRIPPAPIPGSSTPSTRSGSPRRRSNVPIASSPLAGSGAAIALGIGIPGAFPGSSNNSNPHLAPTNGNEPGSRPASHRSSPGHSRQPSGNTQFSAMAAIASSANVGRAIVTPRNAPSPPPTQERAATPGSEPEFPEPQTRQDDAPPDLPVVLSSSELFEDVHSPPNEDAHAAPTLPALEVPSIVEGVTATSTDIPSPNPRSLNASGAVTPIQRDVATPTAGPVSAPEAQQSSESLQPPGMGDRTMTSSSIAWTDDDASEAGENGAAALDYKVLPSTPSLQITEPLISETSSMISATPPNHPSSSTA